MTLWLLLVLKASVGAMILGVGLGSRFQDLLYLWQRPALLDRSLLAIYVAVPLLALAAALVLPLPKGFKIGLLVLAASGGAPLLPRRLAALGNQAYVFSLVVSSSLVAVLIVPTWIVYLGHLFDRDLSVAGGEIARVLLTSFFLPIVLGMAIRWAAPETAERASTLLMTYAGIVLVATALTLFVMQVPLLLTTDWRALATLVGFSVVALGIGHLMGGPDPKDRAALAVTCATRHVGIVAVIAATMPNPRTLVLLLAYLLAATMVSLPYLVWQKRRLAQPVQSAT